MNYILKKVINFKTIIKRRLANNEIINYHKNRTLKFIKYFRLGDIIFAAIVALPFFKFINFLTNFELFTYRALNDYMKYYPSLMFVCAIYN